MKKTYAILLGDDHDLILSGLKDLLLKIEVVDQVDSANNAHDLMLAAEQKKYSIVFLDIHFGKEDGRAVAKALLQKDPQLIIAALTSFDDKETIQSTVNAGFKAFFLKSDGLAEIASWIEKGEFDRVYLSQQTQKSYTDYELLNDSKAKQQFNLSDREKEILRLILEECTTKIIAEKLFLSEKTIENYRSSLLLKLEVSNIAGLVKKTILLGLLND